VSSTLRLCAFTISLTLALSAASSAAPAAPRVYGGAVITAADAPWQVYLRTSDGYACGGSLVDATHVVSAAHCADGDGTKAPPPASSFTVLAGFSDVSTYQPGKAPPPGTQVVGVASYRIHPYYENASKTDDAMVLTLAAPLDLNASPNVKAIALAPAGSEVAGGTAVRVTGFGQSSAGTPDGKLRALVLSALGDDACGLPSQISSMIICADVGGGQSPCHGDSGGPLTLADGAPVLVGIVSYGRNEGCGIGPSGFTDVAAPEVRAFLEGSDAPPKAARQQAPAVLRGVPVQGSPLSCDAGTWDGAPAFTYIFQADGVGPLQSGPAAIYAPGRADVGRTITCVVRAANAGGTSTTRTGTTPAIAPDRVKPVGRLQRWSCSGRTCRFRLAAADPNSQGAVTVNGSARYRGRAHRLKVRTIGAGRFSVTVTRLPRRAKVRFTFQAVDAAGNHRTISPRPTVRIRGGRR
jgi:hypothetical protein